MKAIPITKKACSHSPAKLSNESLLAGEAQTLDGNYQTKAEMIGEGLGKIKDQFTPPEPTVDDDVEPDNNDNNDNNDNDE